MARALSVNKAPVMSAGCSIGSPRQHCRASLASQGSRTAGSFAAILQQQSTKIKGLLGLPEQLDAMTGSDSNSAKYLPVGLNIEAFDDLLTHDPRNELRSALQLAREYQLDTFLADAEYLLSDRLRSGRREGDWSPSYRQHLCGWTCLVHEFGFNSLILPATTAFLKADLPRSVTVHGYSRRKNAICSYASYEEYGLPADSLLPIVCQYFKEWRELQRTLSSDFQSAHPAPVQMPVHEHSSSVINSALGKEHSLESWLSEYNEQQWRAYRSDMAKWFRDCTVSESMVSGWLEKARRITQGRLAHEFQILFEELVL